MIGCRSDCNSHSHPREHWTRKKGSWKVKKSFASIDEAGSFISLHKYRNYKAYVCPICGHIHIGFDISS